MIGRVHLRTALAASAYLSVAAGSKLFEMIPNVKISQTILEFGKELVLALPNSHSKSELEATMRVIIAAWNAVVLDGWNKNDRFEKELISTLKDQPREMQIITKRLIKRKKEKFANDPRAVGKHWVKERNGELVFGCEARLDLEKVSSEGTVH